MDQAWKTFGHEAVKKLLDKHLAGNKFPHAYLFTGPAGLGKKSLALEFAQKVLQAQQLSNHPDFQMLEEPGEISVERIRNFISSLSFKPFVSRKKIAIINDAQNLNQQSSNALLKTLEEPSASTILILIASGKKLLPTIVSRCQVFDFNPFSLEQLKQYALGQRWQASEEILDLSFGSISRLKRLVQDSDFNQEETALLERWQALQSGSRADRLLAVKELGERETQDLQQVLLSWYCWQAGQLHKQSLSYNLVRALGEALKQLQTNKNKKLVLQGLFLKL